MQAEIPNHMHMENLAICDISTTKLVTFDEGERSILGSCGNAGSGRLALFGPGGQERVLLNMHDQELSRMSRITQRMELDKNSPRKSKFSNICSRTSTKSSTRRD